MKGDFVQKILTGALVFVFLVFVGYYLSGRTDIPAIKIVGNDYADGEKIIVELTGEVKKSGKYAVPAGTTVHDVIYRAGGITKDADPESVDLGKYLTTDCTINVSKAVPYDAEAVSVIKFSTENRLDINIATVSGLASLPGIGDSLASDIINYRDVNGSFKSIHDIKNVEGIGEKKFERIKDLITVGGK